MLGDGGGRAQEAAGGKGANKGHAPCYYLEL